LTASPVAELPGGIDDASATGLSQSEDFIRAKSGELRDHD
jgi:hypothetical protein